ncbi:MULTISPECIES: OmpA family protein [Flavobacterium]|uniref:OmpA family protein n=1 Tax=Flavobacterium TaxID=237 RepID=UPI001FCB9241|nr:MULTISPECIES: OmpA family protein [Flavobacterium]UOK42343.1 OmpA family protein [Flavobacterium enshiense]
MKKYVFLLLIGFITKTFSQEKFSVYFDFDIYEVNQDSNQKLGDWMLKNKNAEILKIYGYCDSLGSHDYNDKLALHRANFVLNALRSNGMLLTDKLEVKGFGKRFEQSKIQADNRRVDIYFQLKEEKLSSKITQMRVGDKLRLKNLNFYNRSGVVLPRSEPVLAELLEIMKQNPKLKIEIQGHICCQPEGDVEDISTLRCKTVYNYLIENGIEKNRLSYKGFGSTRPLYPIPERNEFEKDENRRVEIQIIEN